MPRYGGKAGAQPKGDGRGKGPYSPHARPRTWSRGLVHDEACHHPALGTSEAATAHKNAVGRARQGKGRAESRTASGRWAVAPWREELEEWEF